MMSGATSGAQNRTPTFGARQEVHDEDTILQIEQAFGMIDRDNSGFVDASELNELCKLLGHAMTASETKQMLKKLDADGDAQVSVKEFTEWWISTGTEMAALARQTSLFFLSLKVSLR